MPYLAPAYGTWQPADEHTRHAFHVSYTVADEWEAITDGHTRRPFNAYGLPLRPYPSGLYNGDVVYEGIYVDWQHDITRQFCYTIRRTAVADQPTHRNISETFGPFQHPLHPYRAADCQARRVDRGQARGGQARDPQADDYRRWSNRQWSRQAAATVQSNGHRAFGIEIEYDHPYGGAHSAIEADAIAAGLAFTACWSDYSTEYVVRRLGYRPTGWLGTYDSTVSGGEIISDILPGDDASLDQVRQMLAIVRANGGVTQYRQGIHVNHDVRDFDRAAKVRLIDNLQAVQSLLAAYLPRTRQDGYWCGHMDSYDWSSERSSVAAGHNGSGSHHHAFNFGHLFDRGSARVEFRGFGHSLNSMKLRTWIRVGQAIMRATKAGVTFAASIDQAQMLATLRQHGLSAQAANRFAATVANRAAGRAA